MDKQRLKEVILDQKEVKPLKTVIPRSVYSQVEHLKTSKQIVIISGLRRSGKSVLLEQIQNDSSECDYFINFDDDRLVNFQLEDFQVLYELFIEMYGVQRTFYFDEIQNILGWERFVRRLHDQGNKIYITGSNASMLSKELGTRLTGRYIEINLYPYSFKEFLVYQNASFDLEKLSTTQKGTLKSFFNQFVDLGGLPEYLASSLREYLHTLYENIIYRDIIVRHNISNHQAVKELVYFLASNIGKECSYNALRKTLGLSSPSTVSEYCSFLEDSFLCFLVHRFDYSLKKQIQNPKKVYFIDQALAVNIGFRFSQDLGRLLENIVFIELKRRGFDIYYHKGKNECDFLIREQARIVGAIQVCASLDSAQTYEREINGLLEALEKYKLSLGYIITQDTQMHKEITFNHLTYQIEIIPIWRWLLQN